jgi:2-dehydro-3-deoxyphosphooctonate aldolase (KDO 8-P synthase)
LPTVRIGSEQVGPGCPPLLVAGPCVLDGLDQALGIAETLARETGKRGFTFVFKASYLKDNRTSVSSYRGPGLEEGLRQLERVREETGCPVLSDVHGSEEVRAAAEVLDVLQIPAFLCRQTSLVLAAASTGRVLNVKKGQFLAPDQMARLVEKAESVDGFAGLMLVERGTTFGHHDLVVDFRGFDLMAETGYPVLFDVTHSLQRPGGQGDRSGGQPRFVPTLARAGVAAGASGVFLEAHPDPPASRSDADSIYPLEAVPRLLDEIRTIWDAMESVRASRRRETQSAGGS